MMRWEKFVYSMLVVLAIYVVMISLTINGWGFGQDFDPCFMDNDMYQHICDKQEIDSILNDLLERAKEWSEK